MSEENVVVLEHLDGVRPWGWLLVIELPLFDVKACSLTVVLLQSTGYVMEVGYDCFQGWCLTCKSFK